MMKTKNILLIVVICGMVPVFFACSLFRGYGLSENFTVNSVYGTNMVLQADKPVLIAGTAEPGRGVRVTINGKSVYAKAERNGSWLAVLPSMPPGGPYDVTVEGANQEKIFKNVLFGEVWMCSGQSNMDMSVASCLNAEKEIAGAAEYPNIRLFNSKRATSFEEPLTNIAGNGWQVCSPETVKHFSAAGYFFGRKLSGRLNVPIGLINSSWGGTRIQAWLGRSAYETAGLTGELSILNSVISLKGKTLQEKHNYFLKAFREWEHKFQISNPRATAEAAAWKNEKTDLTSWTPIELPGLIDDFPPFEKLDGVFWVRRTISLPPELAGKPMTLKIGRVDDCDETFFNGVKVGFTGVDTPSYWSKPRLYTVPGNLVRAGENTIVIRVIDHAFGAEIGTPVQLIPQKGAAIDLAGKWSAKLEFSADPAKIPPRPLPPFAAEQNSPTVLYNAMIAPWTAYPIRGVIWYQGEANASEAEYYMELFPLLIQSWRKAWKEPRLPFLFVQLAAFERHDPKNKLPENFFQNRRPSRKPDWPLLREVQEATLLLPKTGMAVAIDIGDPDDIHPRNKQEVGRRLALEAERIAYGKKEFRFTADGIVKNPDGGTSVKMLKQEIMTCGPIFKSMKVEGNQIRLSFKNVGAGLEAKGGPLKQFSIAGADGKFVWADAKIEKKTVVVSSPEIREPKVVRYAWENYPAGANLFNLDGFPASPFRTDKPDYLIK